MSDDTYYDARDDRLKRYPGARRLDQSRWITIRVSPSYATTYAGQVAALTAANLFARMSRSVALDFSAVAMVAPLPWAGRDAGDFALGQMRASDPRGAFCRRPIRDGDYVVHLGDSGSPVVTHGAGWLAYIGPGPSPLAASAESNPVGAAFAVIAAAARLSVHGFDAPPVALVFNTLHWNHGASGAALPGLPLAYDFGDIWTVGTGSVGTAVLYFLTMVTRDFSATLFDGDRVNIENLTRSPLFADGDIGHAKVDVTAAYLKSCGMRDVVADPVHLHKSRIWSRRQEGTPDLIVAAANEHKVRHVIEAALPPLQIYGTTGNNWQAAMIRHIPLHESCSCCVFPETTHVPTHCATDPAAAKSDEPQVDASLPFLSFGAGLMAAAEILKLGIPGYPFTANRAYFQSMPEPRFVVAGAPRREGCLCNSRSTGAHSRMIAGTRYSRLRPQ